MAGGFKLFGTIPPEQAAEMGPLKDQIKLLGIGEVVTALLLVIRWTAPLGTLLMSGFWGGVICFHMAKGEPYLLPSLFLIVTWIGSYLRGSVPVLAPPKGATLAATD